MIKVRYINDKDLLADEIEFDVESAFDNAYTTKTLHNIQKSLIFSLKKEQGIVDKDIINKTSEEILKIHGLDKDSFDFVARISHTLNSKINDVSIDDNSNKQEKTIKGMLKEVESSVDKAVGYDYLYRVIKTLYNKDEAKRLMGLMYDFSLGLSDSTNIMIPYCWAMDASKIVTIGREFGQLHSCPAKRVSSYISALSETVHQMSSHLAGAIAIGTFFFDITHLLLYKENIDFDRFISDKKIQKYVENEMQQFVHSVNHLSRNAVESPFTNISIFDRVKIKTLIGARDYGWYFPKVKDFNGTQEEWEDYIIEYIIAVQELYMNFFDEGDPSAGGMPYRFPVSTLNISKVKDIEGKESVEDKKFLKSICKSDIYRYNIFVSGGSKVSSCCRLLSDMEMLELAGQSNSFGAGGSISLGSHRVLTTNFVRVAMQAKTYEEFFKILEKRVEDSAKILKSHKQLIILLAEKGMQPFITTGWIQMNRLFSTFGILGVVEANEVLMKKFKNESKDFIEDMLKFFNEKVLEYSTKHGIIGNIEQIPAESYSHRLARVDKLLYGEKHIPWKLYANQFIPMWEQEASVWERMDKDGKYNQLLSGGGIVHIQIGEKVTGKQAEKLIEYSVASGAEHFALNSTYSKCENNHTHFGNLEICPKCEGKIVDKITRVVGFFTPVSSWHEIKREHDFKKRHEYKNEDFNS